MNKKWYSYILGASLMVLAAFFSISVFARLFSMAAVHQQGFLLAVGELLYNVYGFSAALICVFFFVASIQCFMHSWNLSCGISLLSAIIPFFTCAIVERILRGAIFTQTGVFLLVKLITTITIGLLLLIIECLLIGIFSPRIAANIEKKYSKSLQKKTPLPKGKKEASSPKSMDESIEKTGVFTAHKAKNLTANEVKATQEKKTAPNENANFAMKDFIGKTPEKPIMPLVDWKKEINDSKAQNKEEKEPKTQTQTKGNTPDNKENIFTKEIQEKVETQEKESLNAISAKDDTIVDINPNKNNMLEDNDDTIHQILLPEEIEQLLASYDENSENDSNDEFTNAVKSELDISKEIATGINDEELPAQEKAEEESSTQEEQDTLDEEFFDIDINEETPEEKEEREALEEQESRRLALADLNEKPVSVFEKMDEDVLEDLGIKDENTEESLSSSTKISPEIPDDFEETITEPQEEIAPTLSDTESTSINTEDQSIIEENPQIENDIDPSDSLLDEPIPETISAEEGRITQEEAPTPTPTATFSTQAMPANIEGKESDIVPPNQVKNAAQDGSNTSIASKDDTPLDYSDKAREIRRAPYNVPIDLLKSYPDGEYWVIDAQTREAALALKSVLKEFKIEAEVTGITKGPVITRFEILPAKGVLLSKIVNLQDNIALRLVASSVRIIPHIPGKKAVGIEIPNQHRNIVSFKEIISQNNVAFDKMGVPVVLGKDISGQAQIIDLTKTPHLLIAGSTGSGKSVCVNSIILSILYKRSPDKVRLILIDPKIVELKLYNDIPHLLTPVITEPKRAFQALQYCLCEMERRYALLDGMGVRDITNYNNRIKERKIATETLPYLIVIIDEFADLMATTGKELEKTLARLAAMSRAVGIHIVLATQRPSIDVITGLIKANIPSRIAFMVASKMDSRIIIDQVGAEKLLGKGDMLYASVSESEPVRIQGTFISDDEVENVVNYVKQYGAPDYIDEEIFIDNEDEESSDSIFSEGEDPLYDQALQVVLQAGKASASYVQRRLKIGYNRAARLIEEMEKRGIVGPANGSKAREIVHMP